jgi:hypothetical protein
MQGIDWNVELRKIERQMSGLPPEPSSGAIKAKRAAEQRAQERKQTQSALIGAWARIAVVGLLGAGLYFWPYPRACGVGLFGYLSAQALIVAGGLWVTMISWQNRLARTHAVALLMVASGLVLIGSEVSPRVGYAKVDPAYPPVWMCKAR